MKKLIFLTIFTLALVFPMSLTAQNDVDPSLTEKIKERLEKTAEEGIDNIKEELTEKSTAPRKKAYIGTIKSIDNNNLELGYKDQTLKVEVNDDTIYSKTSLAKLEEDDFIIAMGFLYPDQEVLQTLRVSFIADPETSNNRQLITGKIKEVDGNKIAVDGKVLTITSKTDFTIKDIKSAETEDLELEDNLFAVVALDKNGDIDSVKTILVIPGKNNPASLEPTNATESAEANEATESAEEETEE